MAPEILSGFRATNGIFKRNADGIDDDMEAMTASSGMNTKLMMPPALNIPESDAMPCWTLFGKKLKVVTVFRVFS